MYQLLADALARSVTVSIDGERVTVPAGSSVAAALLVAGRIPSRASAVSGSPRAPYCMMGVCFECLVEIDGVPQRQACMTIACDGMNVRTRSASGEGA
ncbi:MAG TPA: (2Fe-2S)-binding protein [Thermomicrobiales bacterium]